MHNHTEILSKQIAELQEILQVYRSLSGYTINAVEAAISEIDKIPDSDDEAHHFLKSRAEEIKEMLNIIEKDMGRT